MKKTELKKFILSEIARRDSHLAIEKKVIAKSTTNHWHDYFEVELITDGYGFQTVNGKKYEMKPGMLYLLTPNDFHEVHNEEPISIINISFDYSMLPNSLIQTIIKAKENLISYLCGEEFDRTKVIFEQLLYEFTGNKRFRDLCVEILLEYIIITITRKAPISLKDDNDVDAVTNALVYLNIHFRESPSLKQTAKIVHLNPKYFSELFKRSVGKNYINYLIDLKIEYAKKILLIGNISILEACFSCGFNSVSNFLRTFNAYTGMTPTAFIKLGKDE